MGWAFRSTGSSVRRPATGHWVSRSELTGHPLSDVLPKKQPHRPMLLVLGVFEQDEVVAQVRPADARCLDRAGEQFEAEARSQT